MTDTEIQKVALSQFVQLDEDLKEYDWKQYALNTLHWSLVNYLGKGYNT